MGQEETTLDGLPVELADYKEYKLATFLICVCGESDLRGRIIPADAAERCHASMVGFPIVAKLVYNAAGEPVDFAGHEAYTAVDREGRKTMRFGTQPVGSVVRSWMEDRTVPGHHEPKRCVMIQAKLWSNRYPEYFRVLDRLWASGQVKSSWELVVLRESPSPAGRVLEEFAFVGNALLGSRVAGAVPEAGICEYAQQDDAPERELAAALGRDVVGKTEKREEKMGMVEQEKTPRDPDRTSQPETIQENAEPNQPGKPESLSPEEALVKANEKIRDLEEQVKHLLPYKEAADRAERERIERETAQKREAFREKMRKTGLFDSAEMETSEKLRGMVERLDEDAFKAEVADRFIQSLCKEAAKKPETAQAKPPAAEIPPRWDLHSEETEVDNKTFMRFLLFRN